MTLQETIIADIQTIESDMGSQVFTWEGQDYVCVPASTGVLAMLDDGGFGVDIDCILKVRKELFADGVYPEKQQKVTFLNRGLRIHKVINEPTLAFLKLLLTDDVRGI